MTTALLIALSVGALAGAALGFKAGQGYERMRPRKKGRRKGS